MPDKNISLKVLVNGSGKLKHLIYIVHLKGLLLHIALVIVSFINESAVGSVLDWGLKCCWFELHQWLSHCVVSLSKTLYLLLSIGAT